MSEADIEKRASLPGCGLGAYALLLLALGLTGVVGMVMATLAPMQGEGAGPSDLLAGTSVPTWRLAPLVKAGALQPGEIPTAFHDESVAMDGSRACALLPDAVVRVEDGKGTRFAYTEISDLHSEDLPDGGYAVALTAPGGTLGCRFGKDEVSSVLNKDCRAHSVKNLYVVDGSFMPTSGAVPFTLTIVANSFRVAQGLVERMKKGGT